MKTVMSVFESNCTKEGDNHTDVDELYQCQSMSKKTASDVVQLPPAEGGGASSKNTSPLRMSSFSSVSSGSPIFTSVSSGSPISTSASSSYPASMPKLLFNDYGSSHIPAGHAGANLSLSARKTEDFQENRTVSQSNLPVCKMASSSACSVPKSNGHGKLPTGRGRSNILLQMGGAAFPVHRVVTNEKKPIKPGRSQDHAKDQTGPLPVSKHSECCNAVPFEDLQFQDAPSVLATLQAPLPGFGRGRSTQIKPPTKPTSIGRGHREQFDQPVCTSGHLSLSGYARGQAVKSHDSVIPHQSLGRGQKLAASLLSLPKHVEFAGGSSLSKLLLPSSLSTSPKLSKGSIFSPEKLECSTFKDFTCTQEKSVSSASNGSSSMAEKLVLSASNNSYNSLEESAVSASNNSRSMPANSVLSGSNDSCSTLEKSSLSASNDSNRAPEKSSLSAFSDSNRAPEKSSPSAFSDSSRAPEKSSLSASNDSNRAPEKLSLSASNDSNRAPEKLPLSASNDSSSASEKSSPSASNDSNRAPEKSSPSASNDSNRAPEKLSLSASNDSNRAPEKLSLSASNYSNRAPEKLPLSASNDSSSASEKSSPSASNDSNRAPEKSSLSASNDSNRAPENSSLSTSNDFYSVPHKSAFSTLEKSILSPFDDYSITPERSAVSASNASSNMYENSAVSPFDNSNIIPDEKSVLSTSNDSIIMPEKLAMSASSNSSVMPEKSISSMISAPIAPDVISHSNKSAWSKCGKQNISISPFTKKNKRCYKLAAIFSKECVSPCGINESSSATSAHASTSANTPPVSASKIVSTPPVITCQPATSSMEPVSSTMLQHTQMLRNLHGVQSTTCSSATISPSYCETSMANQPTTTSTLTCFPHQQTVTSPSPSTATITPFKLATAAQHTSTNLAALTSDPRCSLKSSLVKVAHTQPDVSSQFQDQDGVSEVDKAMVSVLSRPYCL